MKKNIVSRNAMLQEIMDAVITDTFKPLLRNTIGDVYILRVNPTSRSVFIEIDRSISDKMLGLKIKALRHTLTAEDAKYVIDNAKHIYENKER